MGPLAVVPPAMSTNTSPTLVPTTSEFGTAWVTYALFGLAAFLWWPAVLGVLVCYLRRNGEEVGFLATHYRWLIGTFWWSLLGHLAGAALVLAGAWPLVREVIASVRQHAGADWNGSASIEFDWGSLFSTVGGASLGALVIIATWCWYVYRVVRGGIRLGDARPAP